jgi:hypothetical protein
MTFTVSNTRTAHLFPLTYDRSPVNAVNYTRATYASGPVAGGQASNVSAVDSNDSVATSAGGAKPNESPVAKAVSAAGSNGSSVTAGDSVPATSLLAVDSTSNVSATARRHRARSARRSLGHTEYPAATDAAGRGRVQTVVAGCRERDGRECTVGTFSDVGSPSTAVE